MAKKEIDLMPGMYALKAGKKAGKQVTYNIACEAYAEALAERILMNCGYNDLTVTIYTQALECKMDSEPNIVFSPYYTLTMKHSMEKNVLASSAKIRTYLDNLDEE